MAGSKRGGTSWKAGYTQYKARVQCDKNKARKLAKHLKAHPEDKQAAAAKPTYGRSAPKVKGGWVTGAVFASFVQYLSIPEEGFVNVSRSRAVQKRLAQHKSADRARANERAYTQHQQKQKQAKGKQKSKA